MPVSDIKAIRANLRALEAEARQRGICLWCGLNPVQSHGNFKTMYCNECFLTLSQTSPYIVVEVPVVS